MKTLYLECAMGAAGDMLMSALLELSSNPEAFIAQMNALDLGGVRLTRSRVQKCGITGTHIAVTVGGLEEESLDANHHNDAACIHEDAGSHVHVHNHEAHEHHHSEHEHHHHHGEEHHHGDHHNHEEAHEHHHEHHHSGMHEIVHLIESLPLSQKVREDAVAVYRLIAQAESQVHEKPVDEVHFHEVGAKDAVADIVGCCLLLEQLSPERIVASPVHVGSGQVKCAHGILPVPAPATAIILQGVPIYGGEIKGELCTPTGAALLKHFVSRFAPIPMMSVEKIGYGMGKKDFSAANCVRAYWGESANEQDEIAQLCCNLDDMTGEALAYACEKLMSAGALDVFITPIYMKKGRPATMLTCLCRMEDETAMTALMFAHTTTFGVRRSTCARSILSRKLDKVDTPYGEITVKTGIGYGVKKHKPEFEDVKAACEKSGAAFEDVWACAQSQAAREGIVSV